MAFASSKIGAQEAIIKPCDLCADDENVNWFCKDCFNNLCDRCKKIHLKTATCKNHLLVSILKGIAITKKNASNLCQEHDEHFTFYCGTCKENICSTCLSMVHKRHDFVELRTLQSELQRILENVIKDKEEEQMKMTQDIDELEKCSSQCRDTMTKNYATIDDRVNALYAAANEQGQKLKKSLKSITDKQIKEVEEQKRQIKGRKVEYDETIKTVKQELTLQTTSTIVQFIETSTSKLKSLKPMTYPIPIGTRFTPGRTNQDLILEMIGKNEGKLDEGESHEKTKRRGVNILPKLHIIKEHTLQVQSTCYSICTSPDDSIWIAAKDYVYKIRFDYSAVLYQIPTRELKNVGLFFCGYIACLQSGDAVVSHGGEHFIDRFSSDGKRVKFINLSGKDTYDVAVNNHDEIVVRVSDSVPQSTSSLVIYSKKGKLLNTIHIDKVAGVCINNDGNYVISDKESHFLTTLDRSGTVLKKTQTSTPGLRRLTCDRYGNILGIAWGNTNLVYMISDDGEVDRTFTVKCDYGINDICIDHDNRLLILDDNNIVIVAKYLE